MKFQSQLAVLTIMLFFSSGCLDSLENSMSGGFWGDDCSEDQSDCPDNPAPAFILIDQHGETVNLSQFEGKIVVMTFVYTHCPDVCPALTYQMKKLADELGDDYGESVVFLSVTVDPARDTPERLASFSAAYNASWQFLTVNSTFPDNHMPAMWSDYKVQVLVDEDACSGEGHYMEGYDGCHCNPGYMHGNGTFGKDECITDPNYVVSNITFEQGSTEYEIIQALDAWFLANENGLANEETAMTTLDTYLSQNFAPYWSINDINGTKHKSTDYYDKNLTLLEFFHTDCGHCNTQMPVLEEFHSNFSSEVNIISVGGYSLGGNKDNLSDLQEFNSEHNASWTYLHDEEAMLMSSFGFTGYPSWVLLEGDVEAGEAQIISSSTGTKSYDNLVEMVTNYTAPQNVTQQMDDILESMYHWRLGHISDGDMLGIITSVLNYQYEEEEVEIYGVSHSSRLYIIDQNSNIRVLWRGTEWTYASIYHDVQLLL